MPSIEVTSLYAAIIACLMAVLSTNVGILRGKHAVALGDGANNEVALAIRRFGNLAEYAAMAILVLLLLELKGVSAGWLHAYGIALVAFRLLHPFVLFSDMSAPNWKRTGRFIAAAGTAALLLIGGGALLILSLK